MQYANWQTYAGIDDKHPFGESSSPPPAPPPETDLSKAGQYEQPSYSIAPVVPPTQLGLPPNYGFGAAPTSSFGISQPGPATPASPMSPASPTQVVSQPSNVPTTLQESIDNYFDQYKKR